MEVDYAMSDAELMLQVFHACAKHIWGLCLCAVSIVSEVLGIDLLSEEEVIIYKFESIEIIGVQTGRNSSPRYRECGHDVPSWARIQGCCYCLNSVCPYAEGHSFLEESNLEHKQYKVCIDFGEVPIKRL
jgi:hypothetical protein